MRLTIPDFSLVLLVGASGSGKSTFARRHFKPTEVVSSDVCRGLVADDENDQSATPDAFAVLNFIVGRRLARRRLAVVDATNVRSEDRAKLVALAREHHALPVAIVLDLPEALHHERNAARPDRGFGPHVVHNQLSALRRSLRGLKREGFAQVHTLSSTEAVEAAEIVRQPLWTDRRTERGPFDIVGDVHGCYAELAALLERLGYRIGTADGRRTLDHPEGRRVVFVGDLVDRGPQVPEVLELAMDAVEAGTALCVAGNHDVKLARKLAGKEVQLRHGLAESLAQLAGRDEGFRERARRFLDGLVSHYVLDDFNLVVAHAGLREDMQGRGSPAVRAFALYGDTSGEIDGFGLPVRHDWAAEYRGKARVVYGHTPVTETAWVNNTLNIDTGCVFGGRLTALRYPEMELVSVPAERVHAEPVRPAAPAEPTADPAAADPADPFLLDLADVAGKQIVETRLHGRIIVAEENAAAALEVMSRFAVDPRWLIHLPPTMSPVETSSRPDLLEHPDQAFEHYAARKVARAVCEEKHMGSRAIAVVCRDAGAAARRFGMADGSTGAVYTRTGRAFFAESPGLEAAVLDRLRAAATAAGLWDELATDWLCLDGELMPWSAKAQALLVDQYAPVASAAGSGLAAALGALRAAEARGVDVASMRAHAEARQAATAAYGEAYRRYCWPVSGIDDLRFAPFHLLATEGAVHSDKDHAWHLARLARLADGGLVQATRHIAVDLADPASRAAATAWWEELTAAGGEGMVVKPADFIVQGSRGLVQPALKVRGREYLRLIYGPEYTIPDQMERLRARGVGAKRILALREFALGLEALERFVAGQPLRRVHQCVFAVLALESEPVDPRL
ncbi:MAG TPA: polynucleotide kinase-phosphatase [Alphaproteobacteria bacterium]|nr:polynucleotide kinase-phosphatase [Alphaproteobacteria bacterium]